MKNCLLNIIMMIILIFKTFSNDNYYIMKDDKGIRIGLIKNFIRAMAPSLIKKQKFFFEMLFLFNFLNLF